MTHHEIEEARDLWIALQKASLPEALIRDALSKARLEERKWALEWAAGIARNASIIEFERYMGNNEVSTCAAKIANAILSGPPQQKEGGR